MFGQMDEWMVEREGRTVVGWEGRRGGGKGRRKEENAISKQMAKRQLARG